MNSTIDSMKRLRHTANNLISSQEQARASRQLALREKAKQGLAGQRLGRHKVAESGVDVQLGEELSESLRGLKVFIFLLLFPCH
jgi:nucleolar protein 53